MGGREFEPISPVSRFHFIDIQASFFSSDMELDNVTLMGEALQLVVALLQVL